MATKSEPPVRGAKVRIRAYSPKVRTGCLTCKIRHKKCDEAKPICLRCTHDKVTCDGYAPVKPPSKPKKSRVPLLPAPADAAPSKIELVVLQPPPSPITHDNSSEAQFFYHFSSFASLELAESPDMIDALRLTALPFAYQNEAVRRTMAAVGAAHQLFTCQGSANTPSQIVSDLYVNSFKLYNQAIAHLTGPSSSLDTETVLLCCLLFVCYENMVGRYKESLKHFKAGLRLIQSHDFSAQPANSALLRVIFSFFSIIGMEFSILMDDHLLLSSKTQECVDSMHSDIRQGLPFDFLSEAAAEMRRLDVMAMEAMLMTEVDGQCVWPTEASLAVNAQFRAWSDRFDTTVASMPPNSLSPREEKHLADLRLQQSVWLIALHFDEPVKDQQAINRDCETFYRHAEPMARRLISLMRPTFSGGGNLVSGFSLAISMSSDSDFQHRACELLEALNRREGGWDSRDVAEMHRAVLAQDNPMDIYEQEYPGGIPFFVKMLSSCSNEISPANGLLRLALSSIPDQTFNY